MTANLQRALRMLEDGYPRVQLAGDGSPPCTGLWSFRGDDGGGGGADGLLRVSGTGPTEAERATEQQRRAAGVAAPCAVARRGRDAVAAVRVLIQYMALIKLPLRGPLRGRLAQRTRSGACFQTEREGRVRSSRRCRNTLREKGEQLPQHLKVRLFISQFDSQSENQAVI